VLCPTNPVAPRINTFMAACSLSPHTANAYRSSNLFL
jgi:hypothetical protein